MATACGRCGSELVGPYALCPVCDAPTSEHPGGPDSPVASPKLPELEGYRVVRELGRGGMGVVYAAEDGVLGRQVALKVLSTALAADTMMRARFVREARSMATVEHPHVVRIYSFGEIEGQPYLVMEMIDGESLADRLRAQGPRPAAETLRVLDEVVDALEAAWGRHIVHRDIKPSNILLDRKGRVHVADFGLAKPVQGTAEAELTTGITILGSPHYLSPEQAQGHEVDFRSDIYALGVTAWEMLSGARPFEGATAIDIIAQHVHHTVPDVRIRRADVPPAVAQLLERMTRRDAGQRPNSYEELRGLIAGARQSLGAANASVPVLTSAASAFPTRPPRPASRRWRVVLGLSALAAAMAMVVVAVLGGAPKPPAGAPQSLRVAVTPFYGPDAESSREGRVMAGLVERALQDRLSGDDVHVIGIEETRDPVHSHDAARALGQRLQAGVVVWGEAFALRGETQIEPQITRVPPTAAPASVAPGRAGVEALDRSEERRPGAMVVAADAPNQIEFRKTSAKGIGDLVLLMAGLQALHTENLPAKALARFEQAPRTAESLRYRAEALLALERPDEARARLQESLVLEPGNPLSLGRLADLSQEAGQFREAAATYAAAWKSSGGDSTSAFIQDGLVWAPERFAPGRKQFPRTAYLLGIDPATGTVRDRLLLPGLSRRFQQQGEGVLVTYEVSPAEQETVVFAHGRFDRTLPLPASLGLRRALNLGLTQRSADLLKQLGARRPRRFADGATVGGRTVAELERDLREAVARDGTNPWPLLHLGVIEWASGREADATARWEELFSPRFQALPYYELARAADEMERLGHRRWADRIFAEALKRRRAMPQPIDFATHIERLINAPILGAAGPDQEPERAHVWLARSRELSGIVPEGDEMAAAAWARYFREQGREQDAAVEEQVVDVVKRHPIAFAAALTRLDYALDAFHAALVAFWMLVAVLVFARRQGRNLDDRRAMATAAIAAVLSGAWVAVATNSLVAQSAVPIGAADDIAHGNIRRWLEDAIRGDASCAPARYAAAVAHHLAGNRDRAQELYKSVPEDPRAAANASALDRGALPVHWISGDDWIAAARSGTLWARIQQSWSFWASAQSMHAMIAITLLAAVAGAARIFMRPPPPRGADVPIRPGWTARLVPGLADMRCGRAMRGWCSLALILTAVRSAGGAWISERAYPGLLSSQQGTLFRGFPFPDWPPGSGYRWTCFWTAAHARVFWPVVIAGAILGLWLHVRGLCEAAALSSKGTTEG
jgi:tetratricopeptide (TPR) repeat protein/predicted Ser/Thr protein kinase